MNGAVFAETLRRNWKAALIWGAGLAVYGLYAAVLVPDLEGLGRYVEIFEALPGALMSVFGFSDARVMATPEGFIGLYLLYSLLILAVYAVLSGLSITANDEETGIMDMVLSLPLPRARMMAEKYAAYSLLLLVICLLAGVGMIVGDALNNNIQVSAVNLLLGNLAIVPSAMVVMAVTALLGAVVRRRGTAATLAGVFVAVSFFLDNLARSVQNDLAQAARSMSFFRHANVTEALFGGLALGSAVVLLMAALAALAAGIMAYQRRDVRI